MFSARLRFTKDVELNTVYAFVQEVMELVELEPLTDSLVGAPGVSGLSVEQRKRLTIAVELVANPSIVFMDEPTSGQPQSVDLDTHPALTQPETTPLHQLVVRLSSV